MKPTDDDDEETTGVIVVSFCWIDDVNADDDGYLSNYKNKMIFFLIVFPKLYNRFTGRSSDCGGSGGGSGIAVKFNIEIS